MDAALAGTETRTRGNVSVWIPPGTPEKYLALLPAGIELHILPPLDSAPAHLGRAEFVVPGSSRQDLPELLTRLDGLRVVQAMSAGVEDLVGRIPDGAVLCDGAGIHDASVADWTVMAILAMYRRLPFFVRNQDREEWRHPPMAGMADLEGVRVLIVGYGSIGRAVESRLASFGVTIQRVARTAREGVSDRSELPKLLPEADVVVILLPLTSDTERFVDWEFLSRMRGGALLVNAARGRLVDTDALVRAIEERRIRAALDVTDPEPLPAEHPLWKMDDVLITPHIAGLVAGFYDRAWRFVAQQLRRYQNGEALQNVVAHGY